MDFPSTNGNHKHTEQHPIASRVNTQANHLNPLLPKNAQSEAAAPIVDPATLNLAASRFVQHVAQGQAAASQFHMVQQQIMRQNLQDQYLRNMNGIQVQPANASQQHCANIGSNISTNAPQATSKKRPVTIDLTENVGETANSTAPTSQGEQNSSHHQKPAANQLQHSDVAKNPTAHVNGATSALQGQAPSSHNQNKASVDLAVSRYQSQAAMHMAQFSTGPTRQFPEAAYAIASIKGFKPQHPQLTKMFFDLQSPQGHALFNLNLVTLRLRDKQCTMAPHPRSQLISNAYCTYLSSKKPARGRNPKTLYALTCHGCFESRTQCPQWIHFPSSSESLIRLIQHISQHLASCPCIDPVFRNHIMSRQWDPRYHSKISLEQYISTFCTFHNIFMEERKLPDLYTVEDIHDNNMECMEEALESTTMNVCGVIAPNLCDLVDIDPIEDSPFILFLFECFELARLQKDSPEYAHFSQKHSLTQDDSGTFVIRCNCCHGRENNDGLSVFNPLAMAVVRDEEETTVDVTRVVFNHFKKCFKGHRRAVYNLFKPSNTCSSDITFEHFGQCLYRRIRTLKKWLKNLQESRPKISLKQDNEIWVNLSTEQIRDVLDRDGKLPWSNLEPCKKDDGVKSAVLECVTFPRYGILHGNIGTPTLSDMKCRNGRIKKRVRQAKKRSIGRKVKDLEYFPVSGILPKPSNDGIGGKITHKEQDIVVLPMQRSPSAGGQDMVKATKNAPEERPSCKLKEIEV